MTHHRAVALVTMLAGFGAVPTLEGCSGAPVTGCSLTDSSCADAAVAVPDAHAPPPTNDASGSASDAAVGADASCLPFVDDAGVTHGCAAGGHGMGDHDDGGGMAPPPSDASPDAANLPFGASCLDNAQCASGVCFDYKVKGTFCTQTCSSDSDCPATTPTTQLGCNGMGFCRVP